MEQTQIHPALKKGTGLALVGPVCPLVVKKLCALSLMF